MKGSLQDQPFVASFHFENIKTLYLLRCRMDAAKGGELCRASSICSLSITVEQISQTSEKSLMYEVLADQSVWAICGRAAGVIDMEAGVKQTLIVEAMPLTGGHLSLPKVRLSKYILPNCTDAGATVGAQVAEAAVEGAGSASRLMRPSAGEGDEAAVTGDTASGEVADSP